jgi:hypothetical protein
MCFLCVLRTAVRRMCTHVFMFAYLGSSKSRGTEVDERRYMLSGRRVKGCYQKYS